MTYNEDKTAFQLHALPAETMPFSPYNLLFTQPAYFADERGELRKLEVTSATQCCRTDAPVVWRVTQGDIDRYLKENSPEKLLRGAGEAQETRPPAHRPLSRHAEMRCSRDNPA